MKKYIIATAIATATILTFTGCGKTYVHPNYTPQKWAMDKAQCNGFAKGSYGYNQPYQVQDYNKQYVVNGSSFSNNGVSTNYYGTIRQQPTINQNMNNLSASIGNIIYHNNVNEAFEACLFQKGWRLKGKESVLDFNEGYSQYGTDKNGNDKEGFDVFGTHKITKTKYDLNGFTREGFNKNSIHRITKTKYGPDGYTENGYDKNGFTKEGYDKEGYDKNGLNSLGFNRKGDYVGK